MELDPNNGQRGALASHAGAARFAWNWGLERCKAALEKGQKVPSGPELHREWNAWKRTNAPWWIEVSKCAPQEAFRNLEKAFRAFFDSRSGKRAGPRVGFPRFKKKFRSRDSFRLTGVIKVRGRHVQLPRLGKLKTKEPTRKLLQRREDGRCRILSATVSRQADRWYVPLSERLYCCGRQECGLVQDRDLNAARNLAAYRVAVAVSEPETENACGEGSAGQPAWVDETALCEAGTVHTNALERAAGVIGGGKA